MNVYVCTVYVSSGCFCALSVAVVAVLNQYYNVLGRSLTGNTAFKITVNNHPFPQTAEEQVLQNSLAGIFVGIGLFLFEYCNASLCLAHRAIYI